MKTISMLLFLAFVATPAIAKDAKGKADIATKDSAAKDAASTAATPVVSKDGAEWCAFAAPILEGKMETWKKFGGELAGARKAEYEKSRARMGVEVEKVFHQQGPKGESMAVVVWKGKNLKEATKKMAESKDPFDVWFRDQLKAIHGMDFSQPGMAMKAPEMVLDWAK